MHTLRTRSVLSLALALGAALLAGAGCYPGDTPVADITVTLHDTGKDFKASYTKFALRESEGVIDIGNPDDPGYQPIEHRYDTDIFKRVRDNLVARGWEEIPENEISDINNPDVVVVVSALVATSTAVGGYPPWGWWPGWGYPGYGWGYPCCWTVVQYTTGTLLLDMLAAKDADPGTETVPVPWAARMNGLVNKSNVSVSRLNKVIDQAFTQSPYLDIQ